MARWLIGILGSLAVFPAGALAQAEQIQAGQWQITTRVDSVEMPGAPPQIAAMMAGRTNQMSYCITPQQAAQSPQDLFKQHPSCRLTKFTMAGGSVSTAMACTQNGATMNVQSNGSYTPTSFDTTAQAVMSGRMSMRVSSSSTGKRVGPCTGSK